MSVGFLAFQGIIDVRLSRFNATNSFLNVLVNYSFHLLRIYTEYTNFIAILVRARLPRACQSGLLIRSLFDVPCEYLSHYLNLEITMQRVLGPL
jgi:hypothetical protein